MAGFSISGCLEISLLPRAEVGGAALDSPNQIGDQLHAGGCMIGLQAGCDQLPARDLRLGQVGSFRFGFEFSGEVIRDAQNPRFHGVSVLHEAIRRDTEGASRVFIWRIGLIGLIGPIGRMDG